MACPKQVLFSLFYGAYCTAVQAQEIASAQAAPIQTVEIAGPGSLALRRNDTVAKIVVGRSEIVQYGDGNLAEVLKRQPGITVAAGEVRMRGLGAGYTQILIDGAPAPQDFSIDSIVPEMIERIEILRSATADQSAQAVAGSINLVLRKAQGRAQREYKAGAAFERGRRGPMASMQWGDRAGALSYSLGATLSRTPFVYAEHSDEASRAADGTPVARRHFDVLGSGSEDRLNLAPRLNWTLDNGDALNWQNLIDLTEEATGWATHEHALLGASTSYPDNGGAWHSRFSALGSDAGWSHRIGEAGKLTVKGGLHLNRRNSVFVFEGKGPDGVRALVRTVDSSVDEDALSFSGKLLTPLAAGHALGIGWDGGLQTRSETRLQTDGWFSQPAAVALDQAHTAKVRRMALFVQDEWDMSPQLQSYLGLRWEGLHSATDGKQFVEVSHRSSVFSPSAQVLWKLPDSDKDQLRMALARTYKAPLTRNLVPRRYVQVNDNSAANPDSEGNPALRPELSWGLDLAYETYFGKNGVASVSAFARRISDVTVPQLYRDGANWVTRPVNDGAAETHGIEFDLKAPVRAWLPGAPPLELHVNAVRNWSRLDAVAGPYNRLADQTPLSANVGLDYLPGGNWNAGFNLTYQGGGTNRTAAELSNDKSAESGFDIYALWKIGARTKLRMSASNLLPRDRSSARSYADSNGSTHRSTVVEGAATARLMLEASF